MPFQFFLAIMRNPKRHPSALTPQNHFPSVKGSSIVPGAQPELTAHHKYLSQETPPHRRTPKFCKKVTKIQNPKYFVKKYELLMLYTREKILQLTGTSNFFK